MVPETALASAAEPYALQTMATHARPDYSASAGPFNHCDAYRSDNDVTIALIAAVAVLGVCVVVLGALLISRRSRRGADDRVAAAVAEMNQRMDAMLDDLTKALERAEEEGRRTRTLSELAGTIDFDEVLSRTLDTAATLAGVDAALVALHRLGPKPVFATIGLSEHEAEQPQVVGPPDGRAVRSVRIQYEYPDADGSTEGTSVHAGLAVPLSGDSGQIGYLTVYSRARARAFAEDDVFELEELAGRAGPGRRSRMPTASARRGSSPTSMR
jgi:GAF domain-containing protein